MARSYDFVHLSSEVVLVYGMDNMNLLKKSVEEFFQKTNFKMVRDIIPKAIGRQILQHHWTEFDGTTLLITTQVPALKHNGLRQDSIGKSLDTL
jgi:hypothetical protein